MFFIIIIIININMRRKHCRHHQHYLQRRILYPSVAFSEQIPSSSEL